MSACGTLFMSMRTTEPRPFIRYIRMLPPPEKISIKRFLLAPAIVLVVLLAAFLGGIRWINLRGANSNPIFHQTKTTWQQLPAPSGYPESLQVSSKGTLWVRTWGKSVMSRWDGKAWQHDKSTELATKTSYADSDFALDGEQVWAPTDKGVLDWDGKNWQLYKEATASEGASIVAGGGQVWIIDHTGKLSHFQAGQWQSKKLELPGMTWAAHSDDGGSPHLARTTNGAVWLVWQGLWKLDGANWVPVTDGENRLEQAELVGAAGDRLWLSDRAGLRALSMDGKRWSIYTPEQIGLAQFGPMTQYMVRGITWAPGHTWFSALTKLLEFDGTQWHDLTLPSQKIAGVQKVTASPDGELWIMYVSSSDSQLPSRYIIPFIMLLPLAMLGVIIWTSKRFRRRQLQQHQLVAQAVQHATGEIPEELQQGEQMLKGRGEIGTWVTPIGTIVGYFLVRQTWPQAPLWLIPIIAVSIHLAVFFQQSLVKRKPKPSDPIGPGAPSPYDWGKTWKALAGTVFVVVIINADSLPMPKFLRGHIWWICVLISAAWIALMSRLIKRAMRRADYDNALKIIRWFHFYNPSGIGALRISGHVLLHAGRYREAEDTLRRSLAGSHAGQSYGYALENLGDALMEQGRDDEAMRSYEAALHAFSWRLRPYRGMAEMLLRRGNNPQQALDYVEKMVDVADLSAIQRRDNGRAQDDYWALKAWALAETGRTSEVAPAIESALKATNPKSLLDLATTHYRAGMAMQAMGNSSSANQHFQRAIELDPNGRRGALSKAAMRAQTVWGAVRV
jgi:Tfp pilus assembly protein PilF